MQPVYCYVGGKSAGHIRPALRLAYHHKQVQDAYTIYVSSQSSLDTHLLENESWIDMHVAYAVETRSRIRLLQHIYHLALCAMAFIRAVRMLQRTCPDRVITTGGRIAGPVCCAAWILHIPVDVYELNAHAGTAAYYLSHIADITYTCFSRTQQSLPSRAVVAHTDYPLLTVMYQAYAEHHARDLLGITHDAQVVLVLGGSQGSAYINRVIASAVPHLSTHRVFIHQTGYHNTHTVERMYHAHSMSSIVYTFRDDMHVIYKVADCCIARAGAGTLFELHHYGIPAYIVPLEIASTSHQVDNAYAMAHDYPHQFRVRRQSEASGPDVANFIQKHQRYTVAHIHQAPVDDQREHMYRSER